MKDTTNKKFWDRMAFLYAPFQERGNRALYQNLCKRIADGLPAQSDVLELACGSGQLSLPLCQRFRTLVAATFVCDEHFDPKKTAPLERLGFKTCYKWTEQAFVQYIREHGFEVSTRELLPGNGLFESLLFCNVSTERTR